MADISIIVTNHNYVKYISRCIRSCLAQKYVDVEVIIVDDASTDDSDEWIKPFVGSPIFLPKDMCAEECRSIVNDPSAILKVDRESLTCDPRVTHVQSPVKYIKLAKNGGVAAAANAGIQWSTGQFFLRVDADDWVADDMCYMLSRYLRENHDAFCVSCDYWHVDKLGNKIKRFYAKDDPIACGVLYRRDLFWRAGGYNEEFRHREEQEVRKRLGDEYRIHHLQMPLYRYRMHESNKTKTPGYMETKV